MRLRFSSRSLAWRASSSFWRLASLALASAPPASRLRLLALELLGSSRARAFALQLLLLALLLALLLLALLALLALALFLLDRDLRVDLRCSAWAALRHWAAAAGWLGLGGMGVGCGAGVAPAAARRPAAPPPTARRSRPRARSRASPRRTPARSAGPRAPAARARRPADAAGRCGIRLSWRLSVLSKAIVELAPMLSVPACLTERPTRCTPARCSVSITFDHLLVLARSCRPRSRPARRRCRPALACTRAASCGSATAVRSPCRSTRSFEPLVGADHHLDHLRRPLACSCRRAAGRPRRW